MTREFVAKDLHNMSDIGEILADVISHDNIILFYGSMGAGKTTLIKDICSSMGVIDNVTSPTFALINEYMTENKQIIYHFDFYRINSIEEAYDLGYEEYFYSGNLCLIEWPEKIKELLPPIDDEYCSIATIDISVDDSGYRHIKYTNNQ